ncbi:MAG: PDZ domain-containing protein [Abditibacteriales bacterium]|nr:PDZ domain-containing protein [Abditibacteriales bacterium]MDW8365477.1 PDZ domain-containing protein [Abditibacteriales bacterium]
MRRTLHTSLSSRLLIVMALTFSLWVLGHSQESKTNHEARLADGVLPVEWTKNLRWRCIGPASMGGRITSIAVYEADPSIYWVGTASGGLLKTTNNGVTFEHQFDREATVSIGAVAVAQSDPNIVWVGTGENNPRNSVSWGDGVYKSTDGGKTWKNMGLRGAFQTGDIVIHPTDPNIVYVGALGRLWGPNKERGLYKTTDGGQTWQQVLYVNDKTGVIDIAMKPDDPDTLLVAMWERQRDGFDSHRGDPPLQDGYDAYDPIKKWGPGSGLYRTTDGGKTWQKITQGLPSSHLGRIGLDWYRKDPKVVYAIVDCQKIGMGTPPSRVYMGIVGDDAEGGAKLSEITPNSPAAKAGLKVGDLITAVDGKPLKNYNELVEMIRSKKAGDKLKLTITREGKSVEITVTLEDRPLSQAQGGGRPPLFGLLGAVARDEEGGGVRLGRIFSDGNAERAGLMEDDVIKEVEKRPVKDMQALTEELSKLRPGDRVTLTVLRGEKTQQLRLRLEERGVSGPGGASRTRPWAFMYGGQQPNVQDQQGPNSHEYGGVYRSDDAGVTWKRVNSLNPRPMYFSKIRVDPSDDKYVYVLGVSLYRSRDGGKTFTADGNSRVHPDQHALWINPKDGRHMIVGTDGGFYVTYDRMTTWDHLNHAALGQFYHVAVDTRQPYRVVGGLQDNGTWMGPSRSLSSSGTINEDWFVIGGGDGFVCRVDPTDPDLVYYESQDGNMQRRNLRTGAWASIRPRPVPGKRFRFNWNTPFILSHHNPSIFYCAGNYVFRSVKRGDDLRIISPEIARTGRGTATALAESPRNPDVLWVGTDDGNLWVTQDGGQKWTNVADKVGLPGPRWVASIEPSRFVEGRCYVAFDGHRSDDDEPYVFVTEDFGKTWKSLRANLPTGSTRVLREDVKNQNLLFVGTEFAAFVSLNRGAYWTRLNNNLPTVAVHEFAIHPTAGEVAIATHGRSVWILDITPLRGMTKDALTAPAALYEPNTVIRWRREPTRVSMYGNGHRRYFGENPPNGAQIFYSIHQKAEKASLKILDHEGKVVRELPAQTAPGLHVATWDLSRTPQRPAGGGGRGGGARPEGATSPQGATGAAGATPPPLEGSGETPTPPSQGRGGGFGGLGGFARPVPAGLYRVVLTVDGKEYTQTLRIENDPVVPEASTANDDAETEEEEMKQEANPKRIDE